MLAAWGRFVGRFPWLVLALWAAIAFAGYGVSGGSFGNESLFERLGSGEIAVEGEASEADELLEAGEEGPTPLTAVLEGVDPADPAVAAATAAARADLKQLAGVTSVTDPGALPPEDPRRAALTSIEGDGVILVADLAPEAVESDVEWAVERLERLLTEVEATGPGAGVFSEELFTEAFNEQVEEDLQTGELIALPLSLLVMVIVFGGFLSAGVPIVGAIAAIGGALATLLGFSYLIEVDPSVVSVVTVLGLGLSIDYGLLIVSRYREELRRLQLTKAPRSRARRRDPRHPARHDLVNALSITMATAGRTVAFSGVTVALSLSGLLLFQAPILRAIGAGGLSVVAVALLVALTLCPALLAAGGHRLVGIGLPQRIPGLSLLTRKLGDTPPAEGFFSRLARWTQRRPWLVASSVTVVLLLLVVPATWLEPRASGVELMQVDDPDRVLFETLQAEYPATAAPDATFVARTDNPAAVANQLAAIGAVPGVAGVGEATVVEGQFGPVVSAAIDLTTADTVGREAREVIVQLREIDVATPDGQPAPQSYITGEGAALQDFTQSIIDDTPLALAVVIASTFVLLFLLTGSLVVPLKALVLNMFSLGAALGVLVLLFQEGFLEGPLGFTATGGVEAFIPPLVLGLGFGLSMDYEVFLLSRVTELREAGLSNEEAVAIGLQRSGRIITSAALIICIVFFGFMLGEMLGIKQVGVGLAVAVAVDATLVRVLLLPATMSLLGERNWWAPAPLRRFHQRFGLRD